MIGLLPLGESLTVVAALVSLFLLTLAAVIWSDERKRRPHPTPEAVVTPASFYLAALPETEDNP